MAQINPHIHFNGNTEVAFEFYKSVFGGTFSKIIRFKDINVEGFTMPEEELNKIMHIGLPIGGSTKITGSDVPKMLGEVNESENRSKVTITADSKEEAENLFNALSVGGTVEFPMGDSPWESYFGAFRDQFGVEWMIEYLS